MTMTPHIDTASPDFPGDPTDQPPFGVLDTFRSLALWPVGLSALGAFSVFFRTADKVVDLRGVDGPYKLMSRLIPALCGIKVEIKGREKLDPDRRYVFVANHVNIFDMFVIYQTVPGPARALELAEHFDWPIIGPIITSAGQIPVDPADPRRTARGLRRAAQLLEQGLSIVVLPEAERTLDGSVGPFFPGAFRIASRAKVPVVPLAIRGGRSVSRRGEWRIRPGRITAELGDPIETADTSMSHADELAEKSRRAIIALLRRYDSRRDKGGRK